MRNRIAWLGAAAIVVAAGGIFLLIVMQAQARARDLERLGEVAEIRVALERYYLLRNRYPVAAEPVALGTGDAAVLCDSEGGWQARSQPCATPLLRPVPLDNHTAYDYRYSSDGENYLLDFFLEKADAGLAPGWHRAGADAIE